MMSSLFGRVFAGGVRHLSRAGSLARRFSQPPLVTPMTRAVSTASTAIPAQSVLFRAKVTVPSASECLRCLQFRGSSFLQPLCSPTGWFSRPPTIDFSRVVRGGTSTSITHPRRYSSATSRPASSSGSNTTREMSDASSSETVSHGSATLSLLSPLRVYVFPVSRDWWTFYLEPKSVHDVASLFSRHRSLIQEPKGLMRRLYDMAYNLGSNFTVREWEKLQNAKPMTFKARVYTMVDNLLQKLDANEVFLKDLPLTSRIKTINNHNRQIQTARTAAPPRSANAPVKADVRPKNMTMSSPRSPSSSSSSSESSSSSSSPSPSSAPSTKDDFQEVPVEAVLRMEIIYPASFTREKVIKRLNSMCENGEKKHRLWKRINMCLFPLTFAFFAIPGPPNFPCYWNSFRLYSHWKAEGNATMMLDLIRKYNSFDPYEIDQRGQATQEHHQQKQQQGKQQLEPSLSFQSSEYLESLVNRGGKRWKDDDAPLMSDDEAVDLVQPFDLSHDHLLLQVQRTRRALLKEREKTKGN